jgi:hypothetical protein
MLESAIGSARLRKEGCAEMATILRRLLTSMALANGN